MSSSIEFQVNGRSFGVNSPTTIIEAADQLGIYIPRFCYHKKLSVVANCRMCLVEVAGLAKPVPACATQIMPNMHILTRSEKTRATQRAVMEFLLINHPLDCPICDQGGQCELQDLAMRYGRDNSDFGEAKRAVSDPDLGPLVATEMTRCIQCTRCVRFGTEVAGQMELGAVGRGEHTKITNYVKSSLKSELSGNMIDVCPVGALTSKPFRFKARAWELSSIPSIAPHDCLGSHLYTHVHDQRVMRVVPRENENINEVWLSDRDRYAYLGIASPQRLIQPMIRDKSGWQVADWSVALNEAARLLKGVLSLYGVEQLGGLISASATLEEMYLFQRLSRGLGGVHIDHRLHEVDTRDQHAVSLMKSDIAIRDLDNCEVIVLIGSNVQREQPLLVSRLRKVVDQGGCLISLNCMDYSFGFEVAHKIITPPHQLVQQIKALVHSCSVPYSDSSLQLTEEAMQGIAKRVLLSKKTAILLGAVARNHPEASHIRYWVEQLKSATGARVMHLTEGANALGAWIAGAVPHRIAGGISLPDQKVGMAAHEMMQAKLKSYLLFNVEPDLDCASPSVAKAAMAGADCVISLSAFTSSSLLESAHILLPIHTFAENAGTFVNVEGNWQHFETAIPGMGESQPGWKVLKALGEAVKVEGVHYNSLSAVQAALKSTTAEEISAATKPYFPMELEGVMPFKSRENASLLWRITEWPLYSVDSLVRNAGALQHSGSYEQTGAYIHPICAKRLELKPSQWVYLCQGEAVSGWLPIVLDNTVPDDCVWTPAGRSETATLGPSFGRVEILKEASGALN